MLLPESLPGLELFKLAHLGVIVRLVIVAYAEIECDCLFALRCNHEIFQLFFLVLFSVAFFPRQRLLHRVFCFPKALLVVGHTAIGSGSPLGPPRLLALNHEVLALLFVLSLVECIIKAVIGLAPAAEF